MKKILSHPLVLFLPFFFIYLALAIHLFDPHLYGDEARYVEFAHNILNGYYSPPNELNIWNGPGYPILLAPIIALGLSKKTIVLLNVVFYYLSITLLHKSLRFYTSKRVALVVSLFWACYYVAYQEMFVVFSEPLTIFLITAIAYLTILSFRTKKPGWAILSGIAFGYLILTKVIFWYVLVSLLPIYLLSVLFLSLKKSKRAGYSLVALKILLTAGLVVTPYLFYTYQITGRTFYLANSGGMSLYWMSTPYEGEYGDWNSESFGANCFPGSNIPCNADYFKKNHGRDIAYVQQFTGVEKDDAYKRLAIQNITRHPIKYLKNCVANMGRMWFGFPFSYFFQRDRILLRIPPNAILLCLLTISIPLHLNNLSRIKAEINLSVLLLLFYLGFSTLVSAYQRQFYVIVPLMLLWITYILTNTIKLRFKIDQKELDDLPDDRLFSEDNNEVKAMTNGNSYRATEKPSIN